MSRASLRLLWTLRLWALAVIGLSLAAPLFDESNAWGLWPATYLPAGWRWALSLLAAALVLLGDRIPTGWLRGISFRSWWLRLALALASAVPFFVLRLQHLRWGDAYILIHAIPHPEARLTYTWQAPLDVFVHARAWALGNRLFGWPDPTPVYWILSTTAGVIFVWVLLGVAAWLGRDRTERGLLFGLVASLGMMQLFFGYIENYTLMAVGVLIYLWLALRALRAELALAWPVIALAITHAFHPSTIILAPSLLDLAWRIHRGPAGVSVPRLIAQVAIPYALVFAGVIGFMSAGGHGLDAFLGADAPGGGDRSWFVPLTQTTSRWEHYTMFSLGHLLDIINQQLLVAPVIWPGLALASLLTWSRVPRRDAAFRFMFLAACLYLLLTLTWNPDYGGQRDWDLFAPAALAPAVLLGYTLAHALPERAALRGAGWALIAAQALHTVMWVYQNTRPWTAS